MRHRFWVEHFTGGKVLLQCIKKWQNLKFRQMAVWLLIWHVTILRFFKDVQDKYVVEVGPGPGGITRSLLKANPTSVTVIEKDPRFINPLNLLREAVGPEKLNIEIGDCLTFIVDKMFPENAAVDWYSDGKTNVRLVGNLPFNVATPFFIRLMADIDARCNYYKYGRIPSVLTFQHEVATRMAAPPEDPERCRLSVMSQNYLEVDYLFKLPGGAFVPAPQVEVGVVKLTPHCEKYIEGLPFRFVNKVVTGLFLRKKARFIKPLSNNLFPKSVRSEGSKMLMEMVDIPETKMPIQLTMEEISRICHAYDQVLDILHNKGTKSDLEGFQGNQFINKRIEEKKKAERALQKEEEEGGSRYFDLSSLNNK